MFIAWRNLNDPHSHASLTGNNQKVIMKRLILVFISVVLMSLPVHADDLQDGIDAGMRGDYKTALEKLKPLADKGNAEAQRSMGLMYYRGEGVRKNYREALKWSTKSAQQGNAKAQTTLGTMYLQGHGVKKNYIEAIKWFELAAKQNLSMAQAKLGMMYADGNGVPKNQTLAVKWLKLAAEQGDSMGQIFLGRAYLEGKGVRRDLVETYKWFYIAKANGETKVQKFLEIIKNKMSSDQISDAERLANNWMATHKRVVNEELFKKYQSTVGVLAEEFIGLMKEEREAYVRGAMDGEYIFSKQTKNRELKIMVTCLNKQLGNIISSSQRFTKDNLKRGELMPWPLATLIGQTCEKNLKGEMPKYKSGTNNYDLTKIRGKVEGEENKKKISRAYVRGVLDGSVYYLYGHFYPKINEYLICLSKPKTLDYIVRYFNLAPLMGGLENIQALFVIEAQREKCAEVFE